MMPLDPNTWPPPGWELLKLLLETSLLGSLLSPLGTAAPFAAVALALVSGVAGLYMAKTFVLWLKTVSKP